MHGSQIQVGQHWVVRTSGSEALHGTQTSRCHINRHNPRRKRGRVASRSLRPFEESRHWVSRLQIGKVEVRRSRCKPSRRSDRVAAALVRATCGTQPCMHACRVSTGDEWCAARMHARACSPAAGAPHAADKSLSASKFWASGTKTTKFVAHKTEHNGRACSALKG